MPNTSYEIAVRIVDYLKRKHYGTLEFNSHTKNEVARIIDGLEPIVWDDDR